MKNKLTRKEIFLSCFEFKYQEKIHQHCDHLNNLDEDIILFLARKAACFYRSLESLDLVQTRGKTVITDRALGMDCSWMEGKSVAIIDEIVISGTTMFDAMKRVKSFGGVPKCYAIFVNEERFNPDILCLTEDAIPVSELDARRVSSSMVDALSVLPRPYSVDYPLFKPVFMLKRDVTQLWSIVGWTSSNSTTELQRQSRIYVFTLTPSKRKIDSFKKGLGLDSGGEFFKIRIYGQVSKKGRNSIRVLPIIVLDPLYRKHIDLLFERLVCNIIDKKRAFSVFSSIKSRLRLVQYYIAYRFSIYWKSEANIGLGKELILEEDVSEILLLFTPEVINIVREITDQEGEIFKGVQTELPKVGILPSPALGIVADTIEEMYYNLIKPFSITYRQIEEKQQGLFKNAGKSIHKDFDLMEQSKRLKIGYSMPQLLQLIQSNLKSIEPSSSLLSCFFDVNIDSGIVVPVTAKLESSQNHELDIVFRAYRYGEEAHKGECNFKLANVMLSELSTHLEDTDFQNINTEKFLVLLLIMGQHFLEPAGLDAAQVISVKYDQFGAVVNTGGEGFIAQYEDTSFAKILNDVGVLEQVEIVEKGLIKKGYKLNDECVFSDEILKKENNSLHAEHLGFLLGGIFGINSESTEEVWKQDEYCIKIRTKINKNKTDSLTLLASCSDIRRTALALSAEVGVFIKSWRDLAHVYELTPIKRVATLENFRKKKVFRSINSAHWKFRNHHKGSPYNLKKDIRKCLKRSSQYTWDTMWHDSEVIPDKQKDKRIHSIINKAGAWCLNVFALYRLWEFWAYYVESSREERLECIRNIDISRSYFLTTNTKFCYAEEWTHTDYKSVAYNHSPPYIADKRKQITILINNLLSSGEKIINEAQGLVATSGKYRDCFIYTSSLSIKFKKEDIKPEEIVDEVANEIKGRMKNDSIPRNLRHIFDQQGIQKSDNQFIVQNITDTEWIIYDTGLGSAFWLSYASYLFTNKSDDIRCTLSLGAPSNIAPYANSGSTQITNDFYLDFLSDVKQNIHDYNITILAKNNSLLKQARDIITTSFKGLMESHYRDEIKKTPNGTPLDGLHREGLSLPSNTSIHEMQNMKKIGLLVIVNNEYSAVKSYLEKYYSLRSENSEAYRESRYLARLPSSDNIGHHIILKSSLSMGNRSIINAANRMAQEDNPDLLVILGIGGSINEKHDVGDVLFVTQVNYCEEGREIPNGFQARLDPWKVKARLLSRLNTFFSDNGGDTLHFTRDGVRFNVKKGLIGSSEKVVADSESHIRELLFGVHDKTFQVDMESGGAASFEYEEDLRRDSNLKGLLIIRGASDKADIAKDKDDQHTATKNALYSLIKFLESVDSNLSFLE